MLITFRALNVDMNVMLANAADQINSVVNSYNVANLKFSITAATGYITLTRRNQEVKLDYNSDNALSLGSYR